ncbi:MAG: NAD-dependent epimerase/dehydratase family protein [Methanomicrobia archaeon]|nr:NAD-dependent epimerase/dehydratase family protein [Methanomicrobia archaeon]
MNSNVLITGGSGFLGSHLTDALIKHDYKVGIIDRNKPSHPKATWIKSSLENIDEIKESLRGVKILIHLASKNGIEKSMEVPTESIETNVLKTTRLFEAIKDSSVDRVILTSSSTVYGEGRYKCNHCNCYITPTRDFSRYGSWECHCADCGIPVKPSPTTESFVGKPLSFYALSKLTQEKIFSFLEYYGKTLAVLRFPIVYGPGQTEKTKYAGAVGTIIKRIQENKEIELLEDGYQLRDFLYVDDCIDSILLSLAGEARSDTFNIATGRKTSLIDLCQEIEKNLDIKPRIKILNTHRIGDSRHNVLSTTKATGVLGFTPKFNLKTGIAEVVKRVLL